MKLHWSPRSPFVRKVMITAHECGVADRLECVRTVVAATTPCLDLIPDNPLIKLPTLVRDDGTSLYDSAVICEYFDSLHHGKKLFPADGEARWIALRRQALGDGMLDTLLLWLGERNRAEELRSEPHIAAYRVKTTSSLDALEREAADLATSDFTIGHIAIGCALGYLDFRFPAEPWRDGRPALAEWHQAFESRPSALAVVPSEG